MADGAWWRLNLSEQLGNIGSEVRRMRVAAGTNDDRYVAARDRALELFDLTLTDARLRGRLREIARAREVFCDTSCGGKEFRSSLVDLEKYFDQFAWAARRQH